MPISTGFDALPLAPTEQVRTPVRFSTKSVASAEHPDRNEDAFFFQERNDGLVVAGVFDGTGEKFGGKIASAAARDKAVSVLKRIPEGVSNSGVEWPVTIEPVREALREASLAVGEKATQKGERIAASGAVIAAIDRDGEPGRKDVVFGAVGNSRGYLLREGRLKYLTLDDASREDISEDTITAWDLQGKLDRALGENDLTPQELRIFNKRHQITRALDGRELHPEIRIEHAEPGDKFLLATDGIWKNLTFDEIQAVLATGQTPGMTTDELIARAQGRSRLPKSPTNIRPNPDDMTAIVFDIQKGMDKKPEVQQPTGEGHGAIHRRLQRQPNEVRRQEAPISGGNFQRGDRAVIDGHIFEFTGSVDSGGRLEFKPVGEFVVNGQRIVGRGLTPNMLREGGIVPTQPQEGQRSPQGAPRAFHAGERVTVLRHSGALENDWQLLQPDYARGIVRAEKYDAKGNKIAHRDFRLSELAQWNK